MMKILLVTFFLNTILSQTQLTLYKVSGENDFQQFEYHIIKNTIELYNKHNNDNYTFITKFTSFDSIFINISDSTATNTLAISSISITKDRLANYQFSNPYMPVYKVILKTVSSTNNNAWKNGNHTVGYVKNSTHHHYYKTLKLRYPKIKPMAFTTYSKMNEYSSKGLVDFIITDLKFNNTRDRVIVKIDNYETDYFGIMYHKDSPLKEKFDVYLNYYLKSKKFLHYLKSKNTHQNYIAYFRSIKQTN